MFINKLIHLSRQDSVRKLTIWSLSILLLFLGFYVNLWHAAKPAWFESHQRDTEAHIMGRMVKSRHDGIFSAGGLNGDGIIEDIPKQWESASGLQRQYIAYLNDLSFNAFSTYNSQPGGQGMVFSLIDKLLPLPPNVKLQLFYVLTALLTAIAISAVISWFYQEFGLWIAVCVMVTTLFSGWLTVFGKNLWWSTWAFYLPMIAVLYYLKRQREDTDLPYLRFGILVFIAISIKCFINGYEYMTTTLVMMIVPCVYYAILDKWEKQTILKFTLATGIGSGVAIILSLIILCFQIGAIRTGFVDGVAHVIYSIGKRTYGSSENFHPVYAASLDAGTIEVVLKYLNGVYFDLNNYLTKEIPFVSNWIFRIRYSYLIVFFIGVTVLLLLQIKQTSRSEHRQHYFALICTTWFSILAPMSWYVIFKAHSFIHTHMSFLLWQMPFTLFGFALAASAFGKKKEMNH